MRALRADYVVLTAALVVLAVPFVGLCFYAVPATDDFCKATLSFESTPLHSVWTVTWTYYWHWSSRWLTTLIQSAVMSSVNLLSAYPWLILAVALSNLIALERFFRALLRIPIARSALLAALFYACWFANAAGPAQNVFWLTGAIEYQVSVTVLCLVAARLLESHGGVWDTCLLAACGFSVPALHEIGGAFLGTALALAFAIQRWTGQSARRTAICLAAATASLAIVAASPSPHLRALGEGRTLWDLAHAPTYVHSVVNAVLAWTVNPAVLMLALAVPVLARDPAGRRAEPQITAGVLAGCVALMGALALEAVGVAIASGSELKPRVESWFQFVFWLLVLCAIYFGIPELAWTPFRTMSRMIMAGVVAVTLLGSSNARSAVRDWLGPARSWHQYYARHVTRHTGVVHFGDLPDRPELFLPVGITAGSSCFTNQCLATFLGADSVVATGTAPDRCPK